MTTSIKTCFKCNRIKELNEFYRHAQMGDGRLNKCKECAKRDAAEHRAKNIERIRAYDRRRGSRCTPEYQQEYRNKYPAKYRARIAVNNAVRDGKLEKAAQCEACGSGFHIHGHHDDYSKPLDVKWLCAACHHQWHAKHGEAKNAE